MPISSDITATIKKVRDVEDLDININKVKDVEPLKIESIAPAAIHVKELNNVDPITLEALRINEVSNIEPVSIGQFNVTRLPTVNLAVRQIPPVDMNIRRLPPVSVGLHQDIHIPSDYQVRGRLFGLEVFRLNVTGHTTLLPRATARPEQSLSHERSFPEVAVAGNPAIPSRHTESTSISLAHCGHGSGSLRVGTPGVTLYDSADIDSSTGTVSSGD